MADPLRFLVAESEPLAEREQRRESVGCSSGETYVTTLQRLCPGAICSRVTPADAGADVPDEAELARFDAVFLTGSPLHLYDDTPEVRRQVAFMRSVFASGTPSFGSCAGLQVATVAAGGSVRPMGDRREAGFARRLWPTAAGREHPLLAGRPPAWDAPAIHGDEVDTLPAGATLLASNGPVRVQAAEIRHEGGVFWGVQYHPELSLGEIAAALRRQASDLQTHGFGDAEWIGEQAALVDALAADPESRDIAWRLGVDAQVTDVGLRTIELHNFIEHLVIPTRQARLAEGRGAGHPERIAMQIC